MRFPFFAFLLLGGCTTVAPVASLSHVPSDTAQECQSICQGIGLELSAVVIVRNSAGCVCEKSPRAANASSGAAAASGAVIAAAEDEQQHQNQQNQPNTSSGSHPPGSPTR
jgi:hypothetical protein